MRVNQSITFGAKKGSSWRIQFGDETVTLSELARRSGAHRQTIRRHLMAGLTPEQALSHGQVGYPAGEKHHRARWPKTVVERALLLHERGIGGERAITAALHDEGHRVPRDTVRSWIYHGLRARG